MIFSFIVYSRSDKCFFLGSIIAKKWRRNRKMTRRNEWHPKIDLMHKKTPKIIAFKDFPNGFRTVCVRPPALRKLRTYDADFANDAWRTPPDATALPMATLINLLTLAKFQVVWRRLCDVLFRSSCLFEHTLTSVCALHEYQSCRKYNVCLLYTSDAADE